MKPSPCVIIILLLVYQGDRDVFCLFPKRLFSRNAARFIILSVADCCSIKFFITFLLKRNVKASRVFFFIQEANELWPRASERASRQHFKASQPWRPQTNSQWNLFFSPFRALGSERGKNIIAVPHLFIASTVISKWHGFTLEKRTSLY